MSIVRGPRPESNFYVLNKRISEDASLSWAARGLLIFLLGKPDHWSVSVEALVAQAPSGRRGSGRDAVYSMLTELEEAGYMRRRQVRSGGRFGETDYVVSEEPAPDTAEPDTAEPDTAEPLPVETTLVRTESKQGLNQARTDSPPAGKPEPRPWLTMTEFRERCRARGEREISTYKPVLDFIAAAGIPIDYLRLAWKLYAVKYATSPKRQKDWRLAFLNALRAGWACCWRLERGHWVLTTAGIQAQREDERAAA